MYIFVNGNHYILISLKFVPKDPTKNKPALVQIMAWHHTGNKPLSKPMISCLLMHIYLTFLWWVKPLCTEYLWGNTKIYLHLLGIVWGPIQYHIRHLIIRSHKDLMVWDWLLRYSYHFKIWHVHQQQYCIDAYQIWKQLENFNHWSCTLETLRDFMIRCLMRYWISPRFKHQTG